MDARTVGTNWYGTVRGTDFWYEILFGTVRGTEFGPEFLLVRYVVRILVRIFWYENLSYLTVSRFKIDSYILFTFYFEKRKKDFLLIFI